MGRRHEQTSLQRKHPDGKWTHEKMLNITYHQGNEIKTTMIYHFTPARMAKIKNTRNSKRWWGCREKNPFALLVRMQTGTAIVETNMEVPQKAKNKTTLWSNNCTVGCLPPRYKNTNSKGYMHPDVYIIYNSQTMEAAQMSTDRWMDKEKVICVYIYVYLCLYLYLYNETLFGCKKEWNLAICNNMDRSRAYNAKQTKPVKEGQILYDFTGMWNLRNKTNEQRGKKRQINRKTES